MRAYTQNSGIGPAPQRYPGCPGLLPNRGVGETHHVRLSTEIHTPFPHPTWPEIRNVTLILLDVVPSGDFVSQYPKGVGLWDKRGLEKRLEGVFDLAGPYQR